MGHNLTQAEVTQPTEEIPLKPHGVDLLTVFLQETLERSVFYTTLVQYEPTAANPLAYFPRRHVKRLSEFVLGIPVLKFRAFATPPKL